MSPHAALLSVLLLLPLVAGAQSGGTHASLRFEPSRFDTQRQQLEHAIATDARYSEINTAQRADVVAALDSIADTFEGHEALGTLTAAERSALESAQKKLTAALDAAAEDSRQVCRRETKIGSNMPTKVCKTVARLRQEREAGSPSRGDLDRLEHLRGG